MITYDAFFRYLKAHNVPQLRLIKEKVVNPGTIQKMRDNSQTIRLDIIDRICTYLQCDISDVISYVSPEEYHRQQVEKQRAKVAELEQAAAVLAELEKQTRKD